MIFGKIHTSITQRLPNYLAEHTQVGKWASKVWNENPKQAGLALDGASALFYLSANITLLANNIASAHPIDATAILTATETVGAGGIALASALSYFYKQKQDYTINNDVGEKYIKQIYGFIAENELKVEPGSAIERDVIYTNVLSTYIQQKASKFIELRKEIGKFLEENYNEDMQLGTSLFSTLCYKENIGKNIGTFVLGKIATGIHTRISNEKMKKVLSPFYGMIEKIFDDVKDEVMELNINSNCSITNSNERANFQCFYFDKEENNRVKLLDDDKLLLKVDDFNFKNNDPKVFVKQKIKEFLDYSRMVENEVEKINQEFNPTAKDYERENKLAQAKQVWKKQLLKTFDPITSVFKGRKIRYLDEFMGFTFSLAASSAIAKGAVEFAHISKTDFLKVSEVLFKEARNTILGGAATMIWVMDASRKATVETLKDTVAYNSFKKISSSK